MTADLDALEHQGEGAALRGGRAGAAAYISRALLGVGLLDGGERSAAVRSASCQELRQARVFARAPSVLS
jgi:hypothetical protein